MLYNREIKLKNGKTCLFRNAGSKDAEAYMDYFEQAHSETDYLTTYPGETARNVAAEAEYLRKVTDSANEIEICAFLDGKLTGSAGITMIHDRIKTRHRAEFGISIIKEYWGLGIGTELTRTCIRCAEEAGYLQLELEVVADNEEAVRLYRKLGFTEFGRNPRGFRTREGNWQELVHMRLELPR